MLVGGAPLTKQKALCVATRCTTAEQFIETFHRFCDEQSFFVATMNMRTVGLETPFSIQLADKTPVLRGLCVVLDAWPTAANSYKRPGIRLGIRRLTPESEAVFYQLQAMRTAAPLEVATEASEAFSETPVPVRLPPIPTAPRVSPPPPKPRSTTPRANSVINVPPKVTPSQPVPVIAKPEEQRTPGSDFILPANPLQNLSDESIVGFVDCTLYEETANFFRAPEDDQEQDELAPPPQPIVVEALPDFDPSVAVANFPEEPTRDSRLATPAVALPIVAVPAPVPAGADASVKASLARVEESVMKLLEASDTSKPIDEVARVTPVPAGEAYARQVAKREAQTRSKWLVIGAATVAASIAAVLVIVTQSSASEKSSQPPPPPKPVKAVEPPPVVKDEPKPKEDDPPVVDPDGTDGDEVAAINDKDPKTPVVGEGPCRVDVTTTPAGTMVSIDGNALGPSPITIQSPCTRRRIDLEHPRYKQEQRWVNIVADKPNPVDVTLVRPTHTLTVTSNPSGATVMIAGRRAGTTPTKVSLMGFSGIEVRVEKPGFDPVTKRIYSKKPEDALSVPLKRSLFFKK
jgi:hypothetical protein